MFSIHARDGQTPSRSLPVVSCDLIFRLAGTNDEAFEVLLKKEIGQTDTRSYAGGPAWAVPLVLIPVDALHERQKYSAARGKKYLARLKQLAAKDISL
jgi:hypothetical protein